MNRDWKQSKDELQAFGEKMMRAGWVTLFRIDQSQMHFLPSKLGKKKIKQLWNVLRELDGGNITPLDVDMLLTIMFRQADEHDWE